MFLNKIIAEVSFWNKYEGLLKEIVLILIGVGIAQFIAVLNYFYKERRERKALAFNLSLSLLSELSYFGRTIKTHHISKFNKDYQYERTRFMGATNQKSEEALSLFIYKDSRVNFQNTESNVFQSFIRIIEMTNKLDKVLNKEFRSKLFEMDKFVFEKLDLFDYYEIKEMDKIIIDNSICNQEFSLMLNKLYDNVLSRIESLINVIEEINSSISKTNKKL